MCGTDHTTSTAYSWLLSSVFLQSAWSYKNSSDIWTDRHVMKRCRNTIPRNSRVPQTALLLRDLHTCVSESSRVLLSSQLICSKSSSCDWAWHRPPHWGLHVGLISLRWEGVLHGWRASEDMGRVFSFERKSKLLCKAVVYFSTSTNNTL